MKKLANVFKALSDPARLEILNMLMGRELCVCDIMAAFAVSQPTISHHLKVLKQAGLVNDKREGRWIYYSLNQDEIQSVDRYIKALAETRGVALRVRTCAENETCGGGFTDEE